jgi:hypothetical protein
VPLPTTRKPDVPQKRPQAKYAAGVLSLLPHLRLLGPGGLGGVGGWSAAQPDLADLVYSKMYTTALWLVEVQKLAAEPLPSQAVAYCLGRWDAFNSA